MLTLNSQIAAIGMKSSTEIVITFRLNHIITTNPKYMGQHSVVSMTFGRSSYALNKIMATVGVTKSIKLLGRFVGVVVERNLEGYFKYVDIIEEREEKQFKIETLQHLPMFTQQHCDKVFCFTMNRNPNVAPRPAQRIFNYKKELI